MNHDSTHFYVGLDIAKLSIDVCILPSNTHFSVSNDTKGIKQLIKQLPHPIDRIVMEPTAKYNRNVLKALQQQQLPACVINPRQIRRFAQAIGLLAKTDKIDALVCARFALVLQPKIASPVDPDRQRLADMETARKQFVDDIVCYKNRLHDAEPSLQACYRSTIRHLKKQLQKIIERMQALIQQHAAWQALVNTLLSVKGIGQVTAHMLVAKLPELGSVSSQAIAALVGVAPYNCDSGFYRGSRRISGGRKDIRDVMHMATLVATRHNPVIRQFCERLLSKGKAKKVALIACQRKLIVILNAIARDHLASAQPQLT